MYTESEIRSIGMECLSKKLGTVGMERFISDFIRNSGDYTLSRREMFDDMTVDEVLESADKYMDENPLDPETLARLEAYKKSSGKK